ncbi:hypothetical protein EUTSA_v10001272mg [Eutrema salsugineum]|uniref:Uncharacterized protein n=1 Tax=Eutrema salsugineum TaxID=72664 RepID=V4LIA4_EUTSA|nr:hypothetical protein EUTSA_v10001272mg [Eutrema salsugineum]
MKDSWLYPPTLQSNYVGVNSAWKKRPTRRGESCPTRPKIQRIPACLHSKNSDNPECRHAEEVQPLRQYLPGVPINKYNAAGDPIYTFSDETGHKFFDVCDCDYCLMSSSDEEEKPRRRKKKSSQQILKERYESGDPEVGLLGEPTGKEFEYYVLYSNGSTPPTPHNEDVHTCYMFGSSSSQEPTFPTREFEKGNIRHSWKIRNPNIRNPDGTAKQVSAAEATLNWQSENAMVQNHLLSQIDTKESILDISIKEINKRKKNTKTTSPEKSEAQFMVEHAKNPISTFLEQVAEQTKPPKQQRSVKSMMPLQESPDEEFLIPTFMMAEPRVEEEHMESDGGNISADRKEPQRPQTPPDWNPRSHTDSHSGFSFDNVPPSKWRDKIYEMHAWLTKQLLNPGATLPTVIDKMISKFHDHYTIQAREEYMSMRCCSFKRKDLEKHYERMSKRFYALNGIDDVNMKQAYLNSLPEPLGNETSRILSLKNMTLSQASLGEIYQISLAALEKLCNYQKFFKELQEQGKLLGRACDRPELSIKCKTKRCGCSTSYKQEKKSKNKWQNPETNAKIYIFPTKYDKPIPVIAFFDMGAASSIIKPDILPSTHWDRCSVAVKAANGQIFYISLIICGTDLPGKDFILGFDILHSLKRVSWHPKGLKHKNHLLPWTTISHSYTMELLNPIKEEITKTSCASSHSGFLTKCSSPLWQNPDFFISLPFKKNEDINPTKASHPGMNPDHYTLALEEVNLLQKEGLIEKTTSPWSCEAFYVNKRAEQIRGKLRLREVLFQRLPQAKVFSKFDLKAGLWQLGIKPEDRPKTAFCIPDRHFQWKVMPFG